MSDVPKQISVCICTYKRPAWLNRLLMSIATQETTPQFTCSIVVADNDCMQSAEPVVKEFARACDVPVTYCVESEQNIALARNKAIENAKGDFIAFIDDDEFPAKDWLRILFETCESYGVDGVLGPVKRHFDDQPPAWVIKGAFYDRPVQPTGLAVNWHEGRTGNLLFRKTILRAGEMPFRPEFRAGEDQDFFRRMIERGHKFIWCDTAVAYEVVPPTRWKRSVMLRRALLRGATAVVHPTFGARDVIKSMIAVPIYAVCLPFALLAGQHRFMSLLVRMFDHLGKLLALLRINPINEQYVTE